MAITNDELYLTMPDMSEVLKKLSLTSQFKVSLNFSRTTTSSNNTKLLKYLFSLLSNFFTFVMPKTIK